MLDQTRTTRSCLAAAIAVLLVSSQLRANEPIQAPPAPLIDEADQIVPPATDVAAGGSGLLAPVATDAVPNGSEEIVPAGRRDQGGRRGAEGLLAPVTIGGSGEPNYIPGLASGPVNATAPQEITLPEGAVMEGQPYGEMVYEGGMPLDEATVRISDKPADQVGAAPPGIRANSRICPECRFCQHGIPYHQCPHCQPSEQMVRQYVRRHGVVLPPDYGWSPPGKHPIDRISIDYYRAFPTALDRPGAARPGDRSPDRLLADRHHAARLHLPALAALDAVPRHGPAGSAPRPVACAAVQRSPPLWDEWPVPNLPRQCRRGGAVCRQPAAAPRSARPSG